MELSLLCGSNVILIIEDEESQVKISYASDNSDKDILDTLKLKFETIYTNRDVRI